MPGFRMIEGPEGYLNDAADGPFAHADKTELPRYDNTRWLYEYARDNVETHDGSWSDFADADHIASCYVLMFENEETGEYQEPVLQEEDLGPRGVSILRAAIRSEDVQPMFDAWSGKMYGT